MRLYLASAAQRIELETRWPILTALAAHAEDAKDHNLPLMLWYAAEPAVAADLAARGKLLGVCQIAKVQEFIARRLTSASLAHGAAPVLPLLLHAIGEENTPERWKQRLEARLRAEFAKVVPGEFPLTVSVSLTQADALAPGLNLLRGINAGLKGQRNLPAPPEWESLYATLQASQSEEIRQQAQMLGVTFGSKAALDEIRKIFADNAAPLPLRRSALDSLVSAQGRAGGSAAVADARRARSAARRHGAKCWANSTTRPCRRPSSPPIRGSAARRNATPSRRSPPGRRGRSCSSPRSIRKRSRSRKSRCRSRGSCRT